jgi:hypothetical protein
LSEWGQWSFEKRAANHAGGGYPERQTIVEIVPVKEGMLVEACVKPSEVAFIKVNQAANATPGMTATVEIKTGQKTVLEYLRRLLQSMTQVLRER